MIRKILLGSLRFYQKYLTLLGFGSCRYYPTCSEYARWQYATNPSLLKATLSTVVRILRCNQFFVGGIDYPKISCKHLQSTARPSGRRPGTILYWYVPDRDGCRVIKNTFSKGTTC